MISVGTVLDDDEPMNTASVTTLQHYTAAQPDTCDCMRGIT